MRIIRRKRHKEAGSNFLEYSILTAFVGITAIAGIRSTGEVINNKFIDIANILVGGDGYCDPIAYVPVRQTVMVAGISSDIAPVWSVSFSQELEMPPIAEELSQDQSDYFALPVPPALSPQAAGCL